MLLGAVIGKLGLFLQNKLLKSASLLMMKTTFRRMR